MSERWSRDQVLGLTPDVSSGKAAAGVAKPAQWHEAGCAERAVWGQCRGSGKNPYRVCVDLTMGSAGPAFRCTCPSRKFPCKHAVALLLLWSDGTVPEGAAPGWAGEWLAQRQQRAEQRTRQPNGTTKNADPKTAERRERRVADGVDELDRWLRDQITHGLGQAEKASYRLWDDAARRLVDAQAPGLAGQVRALATIPRGDGDWPERLLAEYALLRLLIQAYRRCGELPEPLRQTVRARVGFTVSQEDVLRGEGDLGRAGGLRGGPGARVRDRWYVAGAVDSERDRLITRRVWLRGHRTGRAALVLSFAAPGQALDTSLIVGSTLDADLAFYPGAQPLRALIAERHGAPAHEVPVGTTITDLLGEYATALSLDPWLDRWPAVLSRVRPARSSGSAQNNRWYLVDGEGAAAPLDMTDPWRLLAVSGGQPMTVAGEWAPRGLVPLSGWHDTEGAVILCR